VSTERGRDPREFALIAFGGAGPIHAAGLARDLHIGRIIVPPLPGLFSALGLLFSGVAHHDVRSCLLSGEELEVEVLEAIRGEMQKEMFARFSAEGYSENGVELSSSVDVRFKGQTSEIRVALAGGHLTGQAVAAMCEDFEAEHEQLYGHRSDPDIPVEVVAVRLVGRAGVVGQEGRLEPIERSGEMEVSREAFFDGGLVETPIFSRGALTEAREGPLMIDEYDSTIVVPPDMRVQVDDQGNLVMEPVHV
jgi:N-methylhydantoinase A